MRHRLLNLGSVTLLSIFLNISSARADIHEKVVFNISNPNIVDEKANIIVDKSLSLNSFYESLRKLRTPVQKNEVEVVSILHLGDSHVQAGFMTGKIMRLFHKDFQNAGRGLITPLKIAHTNEPYDYLIRSNSSWISARCIQRSTKIPMGLGGVSILCRDSLFTMSVGSAAQDKNTYAFNKIKILHHPKASELDVVDNTPSQTLQYKYIENNSPYMTTIELSKTVTNIDFFGKVNKEDKDSSAYYGFILENSKSGVLYHAVGINGAQYIHWSWIKNLGDQSATLKPELIIFSLGTNESFMGTTLNVLNFTNNIDNIIRMLKQKNPKAVILLTTPPECCIKKVVAGKSKYLANPMIKEISSAIINYANANNYAYWDFFSISGGSASSTKWINSGLYSSDRVHFNVTGYNLLAEYLYSAIIKGYNNYVTNHN